MVPYSIPCNCGDEAEDDEELDSKHSLRRQETSSKKEAVTWQKETKEKTRLSEDNRSDADIAESFDQRLDVNEGASYGLAKAPSAFLGQLGNARSKVDAGP